MTTQMPATNVLAVVEAVIADGRFLVEWMSAPDLATEAQADAVVVGLPDKVEAISPVWADVGLMGYLRNRVRSSLALKAAGDYTTAGYQLRELTRKLERRLAATKKRPGIRVSGCRATGGWSGRTGRRPAGKGVIRPSARDASLWPLKANTSVSRRVSGLSVSATLFRCSPW